MAKKKRFANTEIATRGEPTSAEIPPPESKRISTAKTRYLEALRAEIQRHHETGLKSASDAILHAANAGRCLLLVKASLKHGEWITWVNENFAPETGLSLRTAQRYISVAKHLQALESNSVNGGDASTSSLLAEQSITQAISTALRKKTSDSAPSSLKSTRYVRGNKWLTPAEIVEASVALLGEIDLDPASEPDGKNVPAKRHLSPSDDSLSANVRWEGRVFLNAGCEGDLLPWVTKLLNGVHAGDIPAALLVVPAATDPSWSQLIHAFPTAFATKRFQVQVQGSCDVALLRHPLSFVYVSDDGDVTRFAELFSGFADVYVPFRFHSQEKPK